MGNVFFHFDLDAFFASVEQRDHPEYRGKPLVIGMPERRSVVSTCSYEARRYGIRSAMPALTARKLCPQAIFIPGDHRRYQEVSAQVMAILRRFSPDVRQVSIDEAFLDMTGTELLFGPPREACLRLKEAVRRETGLTASVGVASNMFVAKLASDYNKPDGVCVVSPTKEALFIDRIGLARLWGIGSSTLALINSKRLFTSAQVRALDMETLRRLFGGHLAGYLHKAVRGEDPGICEDEARSRSISTEETFIDDLYDEETLCALLLKMSIEVMFRSLAEGLLPRTVAVKIRYGSFETTTVQSTPDEPVLNSEAVYREARRLFLSRWRPAQGVRLLGLALRQVYKGTAPVQGELFGEDEERKMALDKAVLELARKGHRMSRASTLKKPDGEEREA